MYAHIYIDIVYWYIIVIDELFCYHISMITNAARICTCKYTNLYAYNCIYEYMHTIYIYIYIYIYGESMKIPLSWYNKLIPPFCLLDKPIVLMDLKEGDQFGNGIQYNDSWFYGSSL